MSEKVEQELVYHAPASDEVEPTVGCPGNWHTGPCQCASVDYDGGCWCGKKAKGCTGGPVAVGRWKRYALFKCPLTCRDKTDEIPAALMAKAREAGLTE